MPRKLWLVMLAALVTLGVFSACGPKHVSSQNNPKASAKASASPKPAMPTLTGPDDADRFVPTMWKLLVSTTPGLSPKQAALPTFKAISGQETCGMLGDPIGDSLDGANSGNLELCYDGQDEPTGTVIYAPHNLWGEMQHAGDTFYPQEREAWVFVENLIRVEDDANSATGQGYLDRAGCNEAWVVAGLAKAGLLDLQTGGGKLFAGGLLQDNHSYQTELTHPVPCT